MRGANFVRELCFRGQLDVVLFVLTFLNVEDLAHLLIGLTILEAGRYLEASILQNMTHKVWRRVCWINSGSLLISDRHNPFLISTIKNSLETFDAVNQSIERFKKLQGGEQLLIEHRILRGVKYLNYNSDLSHYFQSTYFSKNISNQEYTLCFNTEYDLVALGQTNNMSKSFISVFAFTPNLTKNFGPLVYIFEAPHLSSGVNFSWSPNGKLLLGLVRAPDFDSQHSHDELFFFRYFPKRRVMRQLLKLQLKTFAHYCKPFLWIGAETCVFPSICKRKKNMTLVTFKNTAEYSIREKDNFFPPPINSYVKRGGFSAHMLDENRYCVCCLETCHKKEHLEHHRILISVWSNGQVEDLKIVEVPGIVVDLTFLNSKIFALLRNPDCYSFLPDYVNTLVKRKSKDCCNPLASTPPCSFDQPWRHKSGGPKYYKAIWIKLNAGVGDSVHVREKSLTRINALFDKRETSATSFRQLDDSSITYEGGYSLVEKASRRQCLHPSVFQLIFLNLTHIIPTHNFPSPILAAFEHLYHDVGNNSAPLTLIHPTKPLVASIWYAGKIEFQLGAWASLADRELYPKSLDTFAKFNNGVHSRLVISSRPSKNWAKKVKTQD